MEGNSSEDLTTWEKIKGFLEKNKPIIGSMGFIIAVVLIVFFSFTSCHVNRVEDKQKVIIKDVAALASHLDPLTASVKDMTEKYEALNGILTGIQESNASVVESLNSINETNVKIVDAAKAELTARIVKLEKDMTGVKSSIATVKTTIKDNGLETAVPADIVTEKPVDTPVAEVPPKELPTNELLGNVEIQGEDVAQLPSPPVYKSSKKMGFFRRMLPWNWSCFESEPLYLNWDNKQGDPE